MPISDLWTARGDTHEYEGMPRYPGLTLATHVVVKTTQVGVLLGALTGIGGSFFGYQLHVGSCAARGGIIGAPLGALVLLKRAQTLDEDGVIDRGYRLSHNEGQRTVDALTVAGAAIGLLASRGGPAGLGGAALGATAGMASYPIVKKAGIKSPMIRTGKAQQ